MSLNYFIIATALCSSPILKNDLYKNIQIIKTPSLQEKGQRSEPMRFLSAYLEFIRKYA